MKRFKTFLEDAQGVPAQDHIPRKDTDDEVHALYPKAQGEKDFLSKHSVSRRDYPVDVKGQFKALHGTESPHKADGMKDKGGEKSPVNQGTSLLPITSHDGSKKRDTSKAAGKDDGERMRTLRKKMNECTNKFMRGVYQKQLEGLLDSEE